MNQTNHWKTQGADRRSPDHPVVSAVYEPLAHMVAALVDSPASSSAVDIGCGNGYLQAALEKRFVAVTGYDSSPEMVGSNYCKDTRLGDCTALPETHEAYDVAVAANLLHHLTHGQRVQTLREMQRYAPAVISSEPNRNNPLVTALALHLPSERMVLDFTASYMKRLFAEAGMPNANTAVSGWIPPNKGAEWWIPFGKMLDHTPLRHIGFNIYTTWRAT